MEYKTSRALNRLDWIMLCRRIFIRKNLHPKQRYLQHNFETQ